MARKKKEPTELSVEELQEQLAQMDADRKALEAALRKQRAAELSGFAREIRDEIVARGYTVDEVASLLGKGGRKGGGGARSGSYPQYVDPDNPANTYTRGPVPVWLKEKIVAAGYDPADRAQRDQFKADHLQLVG
jgi:DNA-binding protein H-NS